MGEEEMNYIDPHAANPARNGLGEVGNILMQEVQAVHKEAWSLLSNIEDRYLLSVRNWNGFPKLFQLYWFEVAQPVWVS